MGDDSSGISGADLGPGVARLAIRVLKLLFEAPIYIL